MVTGIGAVTPAGWGVAPFSQAIFSGRTSIDGFSRFDHAAQRTHIAGQVPPAPAHLQRVRGWQRLSNSDRFAVGSALEASAQAGLSWPMTERAAGVFFASSTGGLYETEQFVHTMIDPEADTAARGLLASYSLSAPAEAIARRAGVRGAVETVSSACAASALAIEQALRAIRRGEVEMAFTGGSDCLCITTYAGFNALRAVDERPCRPFRADRAGLSLGEGAAVLVLESLDHALARGATPLAELMGAGSSCDAGHMTAPSPDGSWAAEAMRRALADAGLDRAEIDFLNAHGTATALNDAAEAAAITLVFGERARTLPVEATKGVVGHLLGAAGAVEAVATIVSLRAATLHPTPEGGPIDDALGVDVVVGQARPSEGLRTALSANLGFGGANAAL
ncbi:MAG: beta-ketoacyl-[acyl-carrier-protein] synthase family protein, partial [Acidobacteriota bacterium]